MDNIVALVTFTSDNYGTTLQAYALQKAIEEMGYQVFLPRIRRTSIEPSFYKRLTSLLKLAQTPRLLFKRARYHSLIDKLKEANRNRFKTFRTEYMQLSQDFFSSAEELAKTVDSYCAVVCGSDMIWSPEFSDYLDIFFLTWASPKKRISYAPSFGSLKIEGDLQAVYESYLKEMRFLSCREKSGCTYIRQLTGREPAYVCDPTLLFSAEQWLKWFPISSEGGTDKSPFFLVNCFRGLPQSTQGTLKKLAGQHGSILRFLHQGIDEMLYEAHFSKSGYGPIEFIHLTSKAKFMIVNGYHGLLFALIFRKPFVVYHRGETDHWKAHEQRMMDLLVDLGLEYRYLSYEQQIESSLLSLDYTAIEPLLKERIEKSRAYLSDALSQTIKQDS
nr:polysaccharide pyruvyl transferase family protein [uncultured Porphyromonas sp.]